MPPDPGARLDAALHAGFSGVALPGPPGGLCDLARILAGRHAAAAIARRIAAAGRVSDGWTRRTLARLADTMAAMAPEDVGQAFAGPAASAALALATGGPEETTGMARFLIGAPGTEGLCVALPAAAFVQGWLWLPHPNLLLAPAGGTVLVEDGGDTITFRWTDGAEAAVPRSGLHGMPSLIEDRLRALPECGGWPVLNHMPEGAMIETGAAPLAETAEARAVLARGRTLLSETWPLAAMACERTFDSALLLDTLDGGTASISHATLRGTFIASARDPVQIADALCHEGAHTRLMPVLDMDPLIENGPEEVHPSPWRADPRPLVGVLHGVHAFVNVCLFYKRLAERPDETAEDAARLFESQAQSVREGWTYLSRHARPTPAGAVFLAQLQEGVETL